MSQTQSMLRPRPLASASNRTSEVSNSKAAEETKERLEQQLKLQRYTGKKSTEISGTPNSKAVLQPSAGGNIVKKFVTSTPLSANSQVFKLVTKSGQRKRY